MKGRETTDTGTPAPAAGYVQGGAKAHAILAVLFLVYMSDYAVRYVVPSMLGFIKEDWGISDAQAGWLVSIVILFITVFTVPASLLIDRWSRRKMVSLMVFLWSLATMACAFTKSYAQLLVARACIGIGEAGYAPGGTAMLAAAYPEERRARVMGIWNIAIPLGVGMALWAGGTIARHGGWQHAFFYVGLPGVALAVAAWFLPDYRSVSVNTGGPGSALGVGRLEGFSSRIAGLLRVRSLLLTYLGFAMNVSVTTALMTWLPSYFERTGLAAPGKGGEYTTPIFALVLVGAPLGGVLADKWYRRRKEARLLVPALTSSAATVLLALALGLPGTRAQLPILICFGVLATCYVAPAASATQDLVHPGLRALSYGMCVIVQHLCGDIWSPWIVGALSDRFGLRRAMLIVPLFGVLAAVLFFVASRSYCRDLSRVETVALVGEDP
jgi:MFS family permease